MTDPESIMKELAAAAARVALEAAVEAEGKDKLAAVKALAEAAKLVRMTMSGHNNGEWTELELEEPEV